MNRTLRKRLGNSGYSLIELLVASIILAIAIAAVVAVVRKGTDISVADSHRRRARMIVDSLFEDRYRYSNYDSTSFQAVPATNVTVDPNIIGQVSSFGASGSTIIEDSIQATNLIWVRYKEVIVKVKWVEPNSVSDSVEVTRWISRI